MTLTDELPRYSEDVPVDTKNDLLSWRLSIVRALQRDRQTHSQTQLKTIPRRIRMCNINIGATAAAATNKQL